MRTAARALVVSCLAALNAANAVVISNGNATFDMIGPTVFDAPFGDCTLITDPGAVDQAYKYTWYYRTPNNNTNRLFSSLDTPASSFVGNTATLTYTNAGPGLAGVERFDAVITIRLTDGPAPNQVRLNHEVRFKNINPVTVTYQLFNIIDMDLSGTVLDDATQMTSIPNRTARFTEGLSANYIEAQGENATAYEVNSGTNLRAHLNGGAFNLTNLNGPYTGDGAVAFQWSLTLAPGQEVVLKGGFAVNMTVKPSCKPDFDGNGFVNGDDFDAFVAAFELGTITADYNGDAFVTGDDFDAFVGDFEVGC